MCADARKGKGDAWRVEQGSAVSARLPGNQPRDIARTARKRTGIGAAIAEKHAHSGGCASDRAAASPLPSHDA